jgi:hypothetical protein
VKDVKDTEQNWNKELEKRKDGQANVEFAEDAGVSGTNEMKDCK